MATRNKQETHAVRAGPGYSTAHPPFSAQRASQVPIPGAVKGVKVDWNEELTLESQQQWQPNTEILAIVSEITIPPFITTPLTKL